MDLPTIIALENQSIWGQAGAGDGEDFRSAPKTVIPENREEQVDHLCLAAQDRVYGGTAKA